MCCSGNVTGIKRCPTIAGKNVHAIYAFVDDISWPCIVAMRNIGRTRADHYRGEITSRIDNVERITGARSARASSPDSNVNGLGVYNKMVNNEKRVAVARAKGLSCTWACLVTIPPVDVYTIRVRV